MIETSNGLNWYSKQKCGMEFFCVNGRKTNFKVSEFACKDGTDEILIDSELVEKLQVLRERVGRPVYVNSGYRTSEYNKKVGGVENSQHLYGKAADICVSGVNPSVLFEFAKQAGFRGIGLYSWGIHVDTREHKATWKG